MSLRNGETCRNYQMHQADSGSYQPFASGDGGAALTSVLTEAIDLLSTSGGRIQHELSELLGIPDEQVGK